MVYSRFGYQQEISEANCGLTAWVKNDQVVSVPLDGILKSTVVCGCFFIFNIHIKLRVVSNGGNNTRARTRLGGHTTRGKRRKLENQL